MLNIPVNFEALAKTAKNPASGGYPYSLKGSDLDKNFFYAALDVDPSLVEKTSGPGGHVGRRLRIPAVPGSGTHVLGAVNGSLEWIATEEC